MLRNPVNPVSISIVGAIAAACLALPAAAQFPAAAADKVKGDFYFQSFGKTVAVDGDIVAVGSPDEELNKGAVWVYRVAGGDLVFEQRLTDPTPVSNDLFGISVSVSGDRIAVGSPGTGNGQFNDDGEMYVFRFDGAAWVVDFSVTGQDLGYGTAVDIDGGILAVGFPDADIGHPNAGLVVLYRDDDGVWGPNGVLLGPSTSGFMGRLVELEGEWLFATRALGVDVYRVAGGWQFVQTIPLQPDSMDADGELLALGNFAGVTLFRRGCDVWQQELLLTDPLEPSSTFGISVGIDGDAVLVGCTTSETEGGVEGGGAFVFRSDGEGWPLEQVLFAPDAHEDQDFGRSVALSGDRAVVGANGDDEVWVNSGAAYLYAAAPQTPRWQDQGSGLSGVRTPELSGTGTLQAGAPLGLSLACASPGGTSALFVGFSAIAAPFKGGVLVPHPDLLITGLPVDGLGAATLSASWPAGIPSGFGLYFQQWVTDPGAPAGLAATNALLATTP